MDTTLCIANWNKPANERKTTMKSRILINIFFIVSLAILVSTAVFTADTNQSDDNLVNS